MTTDAFAINQSFSSIITPTDGGTSEYDPNGRTGGFCRGVDGKHYIAVTSNTDAIHSLCVDTGNVVSRSLAQFRVDLTNIGWAYATSTVMDLILAAPGTPYVWCFSFVSTGGAGTFVIGGVLYKIVDDMTLTPVGGALLQTEGGFTLKYYGTSNSYFAQYTINNELLALGQLQGHHTAMIRLPLTETVIDDPTVGSWNNYFTDVPQLGTNFFDFINTLDINQGPATIVPIGTADWGVMIYVTQAIYDYMAAHHGVNPLWDTQAAPGMLWFSSSDSGVTNVTSTFGITDIKTHRDGSASSSYYDDYTSPNAFKISTRTYLAFARSYTQASDLEPVGTYGRIRVFLWDSSTKTATVAFDGSSSLFDPVADCGVSEANRVGSYPEFVSAFYDSDDSVIRYVWYGIGILGLDYVCGPWVDVTQGTVEAFALTFSEFINPTFHDWQTPDPLGLGADFVSSVTTYYMLSDADILFMESPYILCYLDNHARADIGLTMQPQWDWSDSAVAGRWARQMEVYRPTTLRAVAVSKNRVRGRGRALRLYFQSEQSKDFNLLGWAVDMTENQRY